PRLGAFGAGLAGGLSSMVLAAVVLAVAAQRRSGKADKGVPLATVYRLGLPLGLQLFAETLVFGSLSLLAGRLGAHVVSAHQIALGLASFPSQAAGGVGGATAVRVGHTVGAGVSPRHVGALGLLLGACIMGASATAFKMVPYLLISAFTPDAEVIEI